MTPAISATQVSSLRKRTGVSLLAIKSALEEAQGDEEKAIEILRKRGQAQAVKKADREQMEGRIFVESGNGKAAMTQLACETDFVARNEDFIAAGMAIAKTALEGGEDAAKKTASGLMPELVNKLGENISLADVRVAEGKTVGTYVHTNQKIGVMIVLESGDEAQARDVAMHAAAMAPSVINPADVSEAVVVKEKEIWKEQLAKEGKPAAMLEKIMMGKEKKFREESALMKQPFAKDPSMTIEQYLKGAKVTQYVRLSIS